MRKNTKKYLLLGLLATAIIGFFASGLHHELTLDSIKTRQAEFQVFYVENPYLTLGVYGLIYVVTTALSLPGATILTLAGAAFFGFWPALIVASFASSIGATLAFLAARYLLRDWVQARFAEKMAVINQGVEREGIFYLFALRLTVFIPFWLVNLTMGLTSIKPHIFYIVSQIGMLTGTAVYVYAGTQLGEIESVRDVLSPELIIAFGALGIFPLITKKAVDWLRSKRGISSEQI
jgi:uncharacterized membrane protein YdjX (TVP38/TMEM64 family)